MAVLSFPSELHSTISLPRSGKALSRYLGLVRTEADSSTTQRDSFPQNSFQRSTSAFALRPCADARQFARLPWRQPLLS